MKLLAIGSGGREHAFVWRLSQSPEVRRIWCAPGNAGIARERCARTGSRVECVPVDAENIPGLLSFAREYRPDLTVIGPDNSLVLGVVDEFRQIGLRIWGPNLDRVRLDWAPGFAVCVVIASGGYPGPYEKGKVIEGLADADGLEGAKVFHAGTVAVDGRILTNGGRVLGVTAWRDTLREAVSAAYAAADRIRFEGCFCRRDIAAKALHRPGNA